jgi:hypothetical protein
MEIIGWLWNRTEMALLLSWKGITTIEAEDLLKTTKDRRPKGQMIKQGPLYDFCHPKYRDSLFSHIKVIMHENEIGK